MSLTPSKNERLSVGRFRFVVFAESGKFRLESDGLRTCWCDDLADEWRANLAILKRCPPLFPEDAQCLLNAEEWIQSKGGDE
jgi:hypothetical protein